MILFPGKHETIALLVETYFVYILQLFCFEIWLQLNQTIQSNFSSANVRLFIPLRENMIITRLIGITLDLQQARES